MVLPMNNFSATKQSRHAKGMEWEGRVYLAACTLPKMVSPAGPHSPGLCLDITVSAVCAQRVPAFMGPDLSRVERQENPRAGDEV